jgi:NADH-quinone oxidoreductase subunit D
MSEKIPLYVDDLRSEEFLLNMGPQHPSTHGVLRVVLKMDGETVRDIVPYIGYIHRGMEKLFENRRYEQIMPYTDRTDYLSSINNNFAYARAVEQLMGIRIPERAEFMRVIAAELNRIQSHLLWFGAYGLDVGALTPFLYAFREREEILEMLEDSTGGRLTHNYFRIGGFMYDLPKGFAAKLKKFTSHFRKKVKEYEALLIDNVIFVKRTRGVGIIDQATAINCGMSGPSLRGSDCAIDVRKDEPYSVYSRFDFNVPTGKHGDTWDRCHVRMVEMRESVHILEQAMEMIPSGPFREKVPKILKPPAGEAYTRVEGPRGQIGFYIVSDGTEKPYRIKMRAPSFSNLSAVREMAKGILIADIVAVLGSLDLVIPEIDR